MHIKILKKSDNTLDLVPPPPPPIGACPPNHAVWMDDVLGKEVSGTSYLSKIIQNQNNYYSKSRSRLERLGENQDWVLKSRKTTRLASFAARWYMLLSAPRRPCGRTADSVAPIATTSEWKNKTNKIQHLLTIYFAFRLPVPGSSYEQPVGATLTAVQPGTRG